MKAPAVRVLLISAGVLAVAAAGGAGLRLSRSLAQDAVGTIEVQPGRFVREVTARGGFKAVRATPILVPMETRRSQKVAFLVRDGAVVAANDVVVRFDPTDAEREAADGRDDLSTAQGKVNKARADGKKSRRGFVLDKELAEDELDRARTFALTDAYLYSRHQIVESALDRSLSEKKAENVGTRLDVSGRLTAADVALGRIEAEKATLKLRQAEQGLRSLVVKTPHEGLFVLERKRTGEVIQVGETLWPGQKVAEIPDLRELEAQVWVLEADGAGLKPGLAARLRIEGRPGEVYAAKVARVQPVARPREQGTPVKYFEATLALERTDPARMLPGQRVEALITLEEAEQVIAVPRGALVEKDGRRFVYRRSGGRFTPVEVGVGPNSLSRVVVTTGLSAGDRIALRDPSESATRLLGRGAPAAAPAEASK